MPILVHRVLVAFVLGTSVVLLPGSATAETSYHKLKKHLRHGERVAGDVLDKTEEAMDELLSHVTIEIDFGSGHDDSHAVTTKSPTKKPR